MIARSALALTLALAWLASAPHAMADDAAKPEAPPAAEPAAEDVILNLTLDRLAAILQEAGAEEVTPFPGERTVRFKSSNRNFLVTLSSCNDNGEECALVTIGRGVKAKLPLEVLNKLNDHYGGLIAASRVNDETFRILHASIIRGGVTKTNVAITLVWFVNESDAFASFINAQLVADGGSTSGPDRPVQLGEVVLTPAQMADLMRPSGVTVTSGQLTMKPD